MNQTIPAHFDGQHILLDEAVELEPNTRLLVTVLPTDLKDDAWCGLAVKALERAYVDDEEEYALELIIEPNPDYQSR